jgi:DNA-binding LytR/AlgR family response regulator
LYRVALCEDEEIFAAAHEEACREILFRLNIEHELTTFRSGEDFFDAFAQYYLIVRDIMMDGMNGIQLARKIRERDKSVCIIFLTSSRDFALEGYDVNAFHYLLKPLDVSAFEQLVKTAYNEKFQDNFIVIKIGGQHLRIFANDIICMETKGRRVEITLADSVVYYSGKLSDLLLELPSDRFVKCHQAFAVNVKNIRELGRQDAIAINGKKIPVSRTFMASTKKVFVKYIGGSSR